MDVRLNRASKAAALTLLIILTTALVSVWLNNPPPPISWEMDGFVSYSDTIFDIEIPTSLNITYNADVDDSQNTTRIYVEMNTELTMVRGLLSFRMDPTYINPHSWYNISDSREITLSSSSSSESWNLTSYENRYFYGFTFLDLSETIEQNHTLPTEYSLQMRWNSSLTLFEERDNDTMFEAHLAFWIDFIETQIRVEPALFDAIIIVEFIVGIALTVGLYKIDEPDVMD